MKPKFGQTGHTLVSGKHSLTKNLLEQSLRFSIVEPLRYMCFPDSKLDKMWMGHVAKYCQRKRASRRDFETIDALNELESANVESEEL